MKRKLYQAIASAVYARSRCAQTGYTDWEKKHEDYVIGLVSDYMPRGLGFDVGTQLNWSRSSDKKLVFDTEYHHMNDNGMYDGWTEHTVIVKPSFDGIDLRITGRDRDGFKDYAANVFYEALNQDVDFYGNLVSIP